jgi:glycerophosphoryl diester phosphodiesterase
MAQVSFDLQGHRGCRGLMPENSIPAFMKAVQLGVTTLEMDVVISKDHEVVVSHEPWMSHVICSHPDGSPVKKGEEKQLNLYQMDYQDIQQYDCGMRRNPKFPDQKKMKTVKPTLKVVVKSVEKFAKDQNYPSPKFSIEIKSEAKDYNTFQPEPKEFVKLVLDEIRSLGIEDHTILQSFDINVLEVLHQQENRKFSISFLVDSGRKLNTHLSKITFVPEVFSPAYQMVSPKMILECHAAGIKIIPWTVNDKETMNQLKEWKCDGAITDILFK